MDVNLEDLTVDSSWLIGKTAQEGFTVGYLKGVREAKAQENLLTSLVRLKNTGRANSESSNARLCRQAKGFVDSSELASDDKSVLKLAIEDAANPSGYYYKGSGIDAAVSRLAN